MIVFGPDDESAAGHIKFAGKIADGQPGGHSHRPQHDDHSRGVIGAETLPLVEEEPIDSISPAGWWLDRQAVFEAVQEVLDGHRFRVGCCHVLRDLFGQLLDSTRQARRQLQVVVFHPGLVVFAGFGQLTWCGHTDSGGHAVPLVGFEHLWGNN